MNKIKFWSKRVHTSRPDLKVFESFDSCKKQPAVVTNSFPAFECYTIDSRSGN
jgi:hypothetical protein